MTGTKKIEGTLASHQVMDISQEALLGMVRTIVWTHCNHR